MNLKTVFICIFCCASAHLFAQSDFRPGYIVRHNGDTVRGFIDYRSDEAMAALCRFKNNDVVTEYTPNDIAAYRFENSRYFVAKVIPAPEGEKKIFLEFLIQGQVNLYYYRHIGERFFIEKEGVGLAPLCYEPKALEKEGKEYIINSTKHVGLLSYYMRDAPSLKPRIEGMSSPHRKTLVKLAEDYHNKVCQGERCIVYEKKEPKITVNLEFIVGGANYKGTALAHSGSVIWGGLLHINKRSNETLNLRTGLMFTTLILKEEVRGAWGTYKYETHNKGVVKIPIHLEYLPGNHVLNPRFSYGINAYSGLSGAVSFTGGVNLKMAPNAFWSFTGEVEFDQQGLIFPGAFRSSNMVTGVLLKL